MKKLISILLTAVLLLTITACTENALGGKPSNPQNPNPGNGQAFTLQLSILPQLHPHPCGARKSSGLSRRRILS